MVAGEMQNVSIIQTAQIMYILQMCQVIQILQMEGHWQLRQSSLEIV